MGKFYERVYFDNASTTRVTEPVLQEALPYLTGYYGNPSSTHHMGTVAKKAIDEARARCAKAINAEPEQIIFTSGATESNNLVAGQGVALISSDYEHPSMRIGRTTNDNGVQLEINKLQRAGVRHIIVSHQFVNNEIGTIFNIKEYADIAHNNDCLFHTDATQAFSHVPINVKDIDCDFLSLSGHKFHAPKGVGLLYIKNPDDLITPIIGGGQENGLRSGTENVFGVVAMGKAMELYDYSPVTAQHYKELKHTLIRGLAKSCPVEFHINQVEGLSHVDNIVNISFKNINGESLTILLDYNGFCVSTGSACHSASLEESATIKTLNLPEEYRFGSIRVSFSESNTIEEVERLVNTISRNISTLTMINK